MNDFPDTRYARHGRDWIAYQVVGDGSPDVLYCNGWGDCLEARWDWPPYASLLRRLASFSRLILFDRRGQGVSDRTAGEGVAAWERWVDDALAVLDAVGSDRAAVIGQNDSGPTAMLFAATQPERTQALVLWTTTARFLVADDYPWGIPESAIAASVEFLEEAWGTEATVDFSVPDLAGDRAFRRWYARSHRLSCSPGDAAAYLRWVQSTDVRDMLSLIDVPTLVLHRRDASWITLDQGRYLAEQIRHARLEIVSGADLTIYTDYGDTLPHIEEFLTGASALTDPDRALAAILFTDIVGSTEKAAAFGDRRWRGVLESHDAVARTIIDQHRGRLVKLTGDGVLATFDGPGKAVRCAWALRDAMSPLGITIRAGLHAGEIDLRAGDIGGIAVHVAARVLDQAQAGEVLASAAVPMLMVGSGIGFDDRGEHDLKGVPGLWRLFAVEG